MLGVWYSGLGSGNLSNDWSRPGFHIMVGVVAFVSIDRGEISVVFDAVSACRKPRAVVIIPLLDHV